MGATGDFERQGCDAARSVTNKAARRALVPPLLIRCGLVQLRRRRPIIPASANVARMPGPGTAVTEISSMKYDLVVVDDEHSRDGIGGI